MNSDFIKKIIEGALLAAGKTLDINHLESLFNDEERPPRDQIRAALEEIEEDTRDRGFTLKQTASGYRFQVEQELAPWVNRLWEEKPKRYSRAMLETLSLIAYRQPLTRGDIELVRGVAVSSDIIRTLMEREWIRVVGHRDVPGKPALYATTKRFLDYFNLKSLDHLPPLSEIKDLTHLDPDLEMALAVPEEKIESEHDQSDKHEDFTLDQQTDGVEEDSQPSDQDFTDHQSTVDE
jgi:segregation and condensation protein B